MPEDAITIKVGTHISAATYFLNNFTEVRILLQEMCDSALYASEEHSFELKEAS